VFGGVTPILVSLLVHFDRIGPAYYVAVVAVIGLGATIAASKSVLSEEASRPADRVSDGKASIKSRREEWIKQA
jgi:hypothetical protein